MIGGFSGKTAALTAALGAILTMHHEHTTSTPTLVRRESTRALRSMQQSSRGIDRKRAEELYVSSDPADHTIGVDFQQQIAERKETEWRYQQASRDLMDFQKVSYRSGIDQLEIPAYLFQPLQKRGPHGHAAMVWLHGGVHGNWSIMMFPFVLEAVQRGYVVICPEYRGSTGYGEVHYNAIDYGGREVDDVLSAVSYLRSLPHVDGNRVGIMGWSHGGYITLLSLLRDSAPFKAGAAIVPVTNLVVRLSYKGPRYQRQFSTQESFRGLPFERRNIYVERSPVYLVDKLRTPLLVHVATNDTDVEFAESQQLIDALRARKPHLSETKVYVAPEPWGGSGHSFSRRVDPKTLRRVDSPEQIDSWNRVWDLFDWHLRPYLSNQVEAGAGTNESKSRRE